MSTNVLYHARQKLLTTATLASVLAITGAGGAAMADYTVTPPTSVPTTYTDSTPVTAPTNLTAGLTANLWTISTSTGNLGSGGPGNLGGGGESGDANLQGMANLEALAQNGSIAVGTNGIPGSTTGSATYTATPYFSFTDSAINTNKIVAIGGGGASQGASIANVLNGSSTTDTTNLVSGITLPTTASTEQWLNIIFDQSGYVYVSKANSSYTFALATNDLNDDGTEVLLGGNGKVGSGNVVAYESIDTPSENGIATLVNGTTYPAATDTVTFTQAGYYPIEIFNAQTWGGSGEAVSFLPTSNSTPALDFYTATPEPAPLALMGTALGGLALFGMRKRRMA